MSVKQWGHFYPRPDDACWCEACDTAEDYWPRMNVCPDCGNKRCPKATRHDFACTGSNEPGQQGSSYGSNPTHERFIQTLRDTGASQEVIDAAERVAGSGQQGEPQARPNGDES